MSSKSKSKGKKFYWLKFKKGFFATRIMRKMRQRENGDTMTIIYLKLQLEALETNGIIPLIDFEDDTVEDELALLIDEEPELIKETLDFLVKYEIAFLNEKEVCLPEVVENTGEESDSAERMRNFRARHKLETPEWCNNVTLERNVVQKCDTEKEKVTVTLKLDKKGEEESTSSQGDVEVQAPSPQKEFSLEMAWDETLKIYPRKSNIGDAYETWMNLVQANSGKEKEVCSAIYKAVQHYKSNYISENPDDVNFKFVLGFGKWLKTELNQWILN